MRGLDTKVSHRGSRAVAILVLIACVSSCAERDVSIRFLRSETHTFSRGERKAIEQIAFSTMSEVRQLLRNLPVQIELTVRPGNEVIAETGETADAMPPAAIMWTVDPGRDGGAEAVARKWLRATLFHELHHLARSTSQPPRSLIDHVVYEGMATVFERDFAGADVPWGRYPDNVTAWADELLALPPDSSVRDWLYTNPDGRRWIGIRVGAFWVERAMATSRRSTADLVITSTSDVLDLASVRTTEPSR